MIAAYIPYLYNEAVAADLMSWIGLVIVTGFYAGVACGVTNSSPARLGQLVVDLIQFEGLRLLLFQHMKEKRTLIPWACVVIAYAFQVASTLNQVWR